VPFRYLPDVALADIAFEASSSSLNVLFTECGKALTDVMVDPATLDARNPRRLRVSSEDRDTLLYDFLTQLIIIKDVDSTLFKSFRVRVARDERSLTADLKGEEIDRDRHALRNDAKAVTMHMFGIKKSRKGWTATVVLDI